MWSWAPPPPRPTLHMHLTLHACGLAARPSKKKTCIPPDSAHMWPPAPPHPPHLPHTHRPHPHTISTHAPVTPALTPPRRCLRTTTLRSTRVCGGSGRLVRGVWPCSSPRASSCTHALSRTYSRHMQVGAGGGQDDDDDDRPKPRT